MQTSNYSSPSPSPEHVLFVYAIAAKAKQMNMVRYQNSATIRKNTAAILAQEKIKNDAIWVSDKKYESHHENNINNKNSKRYNYNPAPTLWVYYFVYIIELLVLFYYTYSNK